MYEFITPQNITFSIGIIGICFTIYFKVTNPQVALDKQQDLDKQELESKASIIKQRADWDREQNEKRFAEMGTRLDNAFTLAQNHTHTVDVKVDSLIVSVNAMNLEMTRAITKLETTIHERLPKK